MKKHKKKRQTFDQILADIEQEQQLLNGLFALIDYQKTRLQAALDGEYLQTTQSESASVIRMIDLD